jgi:hypothetical protein
MRDIEIIKQSLNGYHLEPEEIETLKELVTQLQTDLINRLTVATKIIGALNKNR